MMNFQKTFKDLARVCSLEDATVFEEIYNTEYLWRLTYYGPEFNERLEMGKPTEMIVCNALAQIGCPYIALYSDKQNQIKLGDIKAILPDTTEIKNIDVKSTAVISVKSFENLKDGTLVFFNARCQTEWFVIEIQEDTREYLRKLPKTKMIGDGIGVLVKYSDIKQTNIKNRLVTDKFPGIASAMQKTIIAAEEDLKFKYFDEFEKRQEARENEIIQNEKI